ncbi:MAG: hypothetical protein A2Y94_02050 [Caldithrix sp. RBG_13_44_9]|nr:MAG: hypothetical protein A2Y94_02050 [Caldithrix sp. RBG_13_44_9]
MKKFNQDSPVVPEKKVTAKFDPASLSQTDLEAAVENYFQIHPKYLRPEGNKLVIDIQKFEIENPNYRVIGWPNGIKENPIIKVKDHYNYETK